VVSSGYSSTGPTGLVHRSGTTIMAVEAVLLSPRG